MNLIAVKKFDSHIIYVLEKNQEFFSAYKKFLNNLGFMDIEIDFLGSGINADGEAAGREEDINEYIDRHYYFQRENDRVDVIFGKDRIFLVVSFRPDNREDINNLLEKWLLK